MDDAFLKSVAGYVYQQYGSDIRNVCMVFPNHRAGIFFNKYLAQYIGQPVWTPQIRTISDLMKELSGLQQADPLTLIFNLYQVYIAERKSNETFDEFYYWGEMLLNDFDDIDKYLVDPKQLFQNLADLKDIDRHFSLPEEQLQIIREFWTNIRLDDPTRLKEDFIGIWEKLYPIYERFKKILQTRGIAYEGMMYREVAAITKAGGMVRSPYKHFVIVGFNALNECEKTVFLQLQKDNMADFFWDYDDYYIEQPWHEAGHFMRENLRLFSRQPVNIKSGSLTAPKNIEVISVPSGIGQAKMVSYILEQWECSGGEMTDTAIVLADEQLLIPVLSSIPPEITNVNVTLGYPLKFTPVYSFLEALVSLQQNMRQQSGGEPSFYHRNVMVLLNHPYIQHICPNEANDLLNCIVGYNRIFITPDELHAHEYLKQLFRICGSAPEFLHYLTETGRQTILLLKNVRVNEAAHDFDRDYWFTFITSINRLKDILFTENITLELPTLIKVLRKLSNGLSIPFRGEPLAGLQVMGMLETRAIDFKNIILLSVNEGILPRTEAAASFIPYNLRRGFGLPTIEHQDAVYAYYFYRLMQRAKNVAMLYNTQSGKGANEKSRFIYQLMYEPAFTIKMRNMSFQVSIAGEKEIIIKKDTQLLESLRRYTTTSVTGPILTPTALNAYLECRLRFYFRYIAGIRETEEISEDIEGSMFGKLLHYTMEQVYAGYLGKTIYEPDFNSLINEGRFLEDCVLKAFASEFYKKPGKTPKIHGKSLVVKEILLKYVRQILKVDKKYQPLTILGSEKTYSSQIAIEIAETPIIVKVGGKIDRIDKTGNTFRVIDYKTGKVDYHFTGIEQLFDVEGKTQNKEALQILLYALVLSEDKDYEHLPVTPGIYGLRDIFKQNFDPLLLMAKNEKIEHFNEVRSTYINGLQGLLTEIFDPSVPFTKVVDRKKCEFCDYKLICHR